MLFAESTSKMADMDRPQAPVRRTMRTAPPSRPSRPIPPTVVLTAPSTVPDPHRTLGALKRLAVAVAVVAIGVLGGLVATHPVGAASVASTSHGAGSVTPGAAPVTASDPFFDTGAGSLPQPNLRAGGRYASMQSGGS